MFDGRCVLPQGLQETCRAEDNRVVHFLLGIGESEVVGRCCMDDCLEGRIRLDGMVEGVVFCDVFDDHVR